MNTKIIIGVVAAVLIAVAVYVFMAQPEPAEQMVEIAPVKPIAPVPPQIIEPEPEPEPEPEVTPTEPLDSKVRSPNNLDGSDVTVALAIVDLSQPLAQWLTPEEQIRKWVLFVDNAANGDVVNKHLPWQYNMGKPEVIKTGDTMVFAAQNYDRAKPLLDVVLAIEPERLADYYYGWLPLFEKAYRELGKRGSFDARFKQALDNVLAVESLPVDPQVTLPTVMYHFEDESQQKASDINKLMWRLGNDNTQAIQVYLKDLRARL